MVISMKFHVCRMTCFLGVNFGQKIIHAVAIICICVPTVLTLYNSITISLTVNWFFMVVVAKVRVVRAVGRSHRHKPTQNATWDSCICYTSFKKRKSESGKLMECSPRVTLCLFTCSLILMSLHIQSKLHIGKFSQNWKWVNLFTVWLSYWCIPKCSYFSKILYLQNLIFKIQLHQTGRGMINTINRYKFRQIWKLVS